MNFTLAKAGFPIYRCDAVYRAARHCTEGVATDSCASLYVTSQIYRIDSIPTWLSAGENLRIGGWPWKWLPRSLRSTQSMKITSQTGSAAARNAKRSLRLLLPVCSLLCSALMAVLSDGQAALAGSRQAPTRALDVPELDDGFHSLYELKFEEARTHFEVWQKSHPDDPLGSASEAASFLFEECYRQGILTSGFFQDDKRFLGKIPLKPDAKLRAEFFAADQQARNLAQLRLKANADDPNALFAMTLSLGMQANYASLIDKHQLDSLKKVREADVYAKKLLAVAPDATDAYLGLGMANYFIGSLPGTKKFFLGLAGIHGNKNAGIQQLEIAAEHGHYLRPFAKILLALAALREKKTDVARAQLTDLVAEFPKNPLFASELARLQVSPAANTSHQE
jgi:hypothetical protein